jgi:uncharacterized protein with PQ loop repeat
LFEYASSEFILSPQFVEIYKLKEVRGISLLFMAVDIAGGVFSLLSLAFKEHMDYIAAISYLGVIVSNRLTFFGLL